MKPTQADREAAADTSPHNERWGMLVRAGHMDNDPLVRAFTAHRLASTTPSARITDDKDRENSVEGVHPTPASQTACERAEAIFLNWSHGFKDEALEEVARLIEGAASDMAGDEDLVEKAALAAWIAYSVRPEDEDSEEEGDYNIAAATKDWHEWPGGCTHIGADGFRACARAALKAIAALRPQSERAEIVSWQPIETAPKDGTWILVYEPSEYMPNRHVVCWGDPEWRMSSDSCKKTWVTMALGPNPDTYDVDAATHWMPLPAPPSIPTPVEL